MPSTTSSSVSSDLASSTVMTPSLPTFFMASERNLPISAISSFEVTFLEFFCRSATTASAAMSIPRFRSIGFMPAATALAPSRTIAAASTVAGGGAVAGRVSRFGGDFAHHLGAHVLELVLELDLLGDGDAVLGDAGSAERLLENDVAALRAERHLDGVGENVDAAQHAVAGIDAEFDFFS